MMEKYRVHEVAKDLNIPSKEIIDFLNENFDEPKKHMTALEENELNLVFEHYTKQTQVENFEEYFAMGEEKKVVPTISEDKASIKPTAKTESKSEGKQENKSTTKPENKPAIKQENKPVAKVEDKPAIKQENKPVAKSEVKPESKMEDNKTPANKPEVTRPVMRPNTNTRPADGVVRPQGGYNNNNANRPQGGFNNNANRPQGTFNKDGENRPQGTFNRDGANRPQGGYNNNANRPQGTFNKDGDNRPQGGYNNGGNRPQGTFNKDGDNRPQGGYNNGGNRPQGTFNKDGDNRPQGGYNNGGNRPQGGYSNGGNRPQGGGFNKDGDNRPQGGYNNGGNRPQSGGFNKDGGNRFNNNNSGFNSSARPTTTKHIHPANIPRKTNPNVDLTETKIVDLRAAHVDLDKYNERYEQIAPTNLSAKANDTVKKQKFQRNNRKGKPTLSKNEKEVEKLRRLELERQRRQKLEITIPEEISVGDLAAKLKVQASEIVKRLIPLGIMAAISDVIDYDTASLVAIEIGAKVSPEVIVTIEERLFVNDEVEDGNLLPRSPIVVVMGHVDHGKTSLLDAIRKTAVTTGEAGGITQHIGAYQVEVNGKKITFLDTPGHAAFTSMRARGAQVTDIAILVVAADDGIMPQTVEAINHAKAAGVNIIVAINKIDKPAANVEKVKQELTEYGLVPEEWGGDVICVPISAKTGENMETLLEMVQLVADVKELKANPDRLAKGTVIEANLDKGKGPVATLLIQTGTLHIGDVIIAGSALGRVRIMLDDKGNHIDEAGPSTPVSITGLDTVPSAGDIFNSVENEKLAKELVDKRKHEAKEEQFSSYQKVTLENLFEQISEGDMKELAIIVKADVQGSVEAITQSLEKISNDEVRVKVIHGAVGAVSESDVMLASASNAIIVGFNVRPDTIARENAERDNVDVRLYRIIYDAIDEIESAMKGMLAPKFRDVDLGRAEVRTVYKITNVGTVAGCYVTEGRITRNANIRIVRDGIIIADDKLDSLKRFKDDVKEVARGFECGMSLLKFKDLKEGDYFEAYEVEEYRD